MLVAMISVIENTTLQDFVITWLCNWGTNLYNTVAR